MDRKKHKPQSINGQNAAEINGIFIFADWIDIILMILGTIGSIGDGCSTNLLLIIISKVMNELGHAKLSTNHANFMQLIDECCLYFVYLAITTMVIVFMEGYCWSRTSERQVPRMRYMYLEAILRQEVGFFDSQDTSISEIINSMSKDTSLIQEVLSEKVPMCIVLLSRFSSGLILSVYFSWHLFLVAFPLILLLILPGFVYGKYLMYLSRKFRAEYSKANSLVEQALSSIKIIYSFTAERRIVDKYATILDNVVKFGIKQGIAKGLAVGCTTLSFAIWGFLAWYGSKLIMYHGEKGIRIYASGVSFVFAGSSLGMALPEMKHFMEASIVANHILNRINRTPQINTDGSTKLELDQIRGELEFDSVHFTYPSRPNSIILQDFSLHVPAGQTIALVGSSGCGKSTVISLVQRFYDTDEGIVKIDGYDIKKIQLGWMRGKMGLVSQEHALFGTSIKENILFGKPKATIEELYASAMTANAHNFIQELPEGYDTKIGERGAMLSGGQKQRITIARAIIKNPAILLLDEATSALDSESEKLVQTALDHASMGRTTLVVAHKLSTIKNADQIAVVDQGKIIEIGSHQELFAKKGHYFRLVNLQKYTSFKNQEQDSNYLGSTPKSTMSQTSITKASPLNQNPFHKKENLTQVENFHQSPSFSRLLAMNSPEWKQAVIGSFSAIVYGALQPTYALTLGGMISAFFETNHDEVNKIIRRYALIFSSLSLVSIVVNLLQHYSFAHMGENLVRRVRVQVLAKILSFEASWFDEESNSSGALCSKLSNEAYLLKTLVADRISLLVQTISGILIAVTMSFILAWKLTIIFIAIQPIVISCYYMKKIVLSNVSNILTKAQYQSTQIAIESVYNHRIVTSFGCSNLVLQLFEQAQEEPLKAASRKSWVAGLAMGFSPFLVYMSCALEFWYGGRLVNLGQILASDVFKIFTIFISTSRVIADAASMTSDLVKGSNAISSIFEVLDRNSSTLQENQNTKNNKPQKRIQGRIEFKEVHFAYPTRLQCQILQEFNLQVEAGKSIGLVGKSGCGKSTIINLIQRFYDVDKGVIKIDGMDLRELDIIWFRGFTALVSQEPVLFSDSIRDNISFGKPEAGEEEILEASRSANAHEFISSLKDGYNTYCGERGVQLSGGQKQRIAIARAIIRNPSILLLDEATSALDVQSEQVVQEALDRIMLGRTTIVVAHRLNTIKNVDSIALLGEGKVTERGSYQELMSKKGAFYNLAILPR